MSPHPFRDRAAIAGVASTDYHRDSGVSTLTLALQAISAAVADAGLTLDDIDGVATHRVDDSVQAPVVAEALGIRDLRYYLDQFGGGSASHSVVGQAAMAVITGQAEAVVCWRSINARSGRRMGGTGQDPYTSLEYQYQVPYGYATPPQQFAMMSRTYLAERGITDEQLGAVAIAQREHARHNDRAMMRDELTLEDYLASRWIVEPLRLFDCCLETDAAVAIVVTRTERARDLAKPPILISGAVWGPGSNLVSNGRSTLWSSGAAIAAERLWHQADLQPTDVDVAEIYDAFTPLVPLQLEQYGLCAPGDAAAFIADGHTRPGGSLPVNTHGGHLSGGYVHGLNHLMEAVEQLRGESGPRQVPDAEIALSTGQPGFVAGNSSAILLRTDR